MLLQLCDREQRTQAARRNQKGCKMEPAPPPPPPPPPPAAPSRDVAPGRAITMPAGINAVSIIPTALLDDSDSSDEEEYPDVSPASRAITLPSVSAQELMQLFPGDAKGFDPSVGFPFKKTSGSSKEKIVKDQSAYLLELAERLRNNDFEFVAQREAQAAAAAAAEPAPPGFHRDDTVIIFDWDDTLFPTWFITEVVQPCLADPQGDLPEDSAFGEPLLRHAQAVKSVLEAARACGRVGLVTLAQNPWVLTSAGKFLPGLDFEELLASLDMPIIYARECLKKHMIAQGQQDDGLCLWTLSKQAAMKKMLKKLYGRRAWINVLSIGDSTTERTAITELLWSTPEDSAGRAPCCKTIKLMEDPSVEQLSTQLIMLSMWMQHLSQHTSDFDVSMDDSDECMLNIKQFL